MPFDLLPADLAFDTDGLDFGHRLTLLALAAFSTVWVTAVGAAVGSFLNVVVYRLPRGMSLVRPKSKCPVCGTPIRASDNVPVLGWMRLRGRCRACGNPISSRYPLVEAATALLFLGLAHVELFAGGANLPGGPEHAGGLGFVLWHLRPALIGLYAYHAALLAALLCLSLIAWDGFPPPRRLVVAMLVIGFAVPIFLPVARPVASGLPAAWLPWWTHSIGGVEFVVAPGTLFDGLLGLSVGVAVGSLITLAVPHGSRAGSDRRGTITVGGLIGLFLGWQAAIACGLLATGLAVVNAVASRVVRRPLPVTALLAATPLVQIAFWRELSRLDAWPGHHGWGLLREAGWPESGFAVTSLVAAAVAAGVLAWTAGRIARTEETPSTRADESPAETDMPESIAS